MRNGPKIKRRAGWLAASAGRAAGPGGFTLLEVIIAIGAVAVVSVGLAAIFQTVGKTVTQGQKVSALTQYAATFEQQLRRDFSSMTREGFLVIRNQFAGPRNGGADWPVGINKDDSNPRQRRVDEVLFFTKGEFETGRAPVNPMIVARGDTAMIYYGHGLIPVHRDSNNDGRPDVQDVRPSVSSINDPDPNRGTDVPPGRTDLFAYAGGGTFGEALAGGFALPNTYAENWVLLRKRTILAKPKTAREGFPSRGWPQVLRGEAGGQQLAGRLSENLVQIGTQPAASSIFRSLARVSSITPPNVQVRPGVLVRPTTGQAGDPGSAFPQLSSGLVDLAATDLDEVRTIVQTFQVNPWDGNLLQRYNSITYADAANPRNADWDAQYRLSDNAELDRMHAWMEDAFPTQSNRFQSGARPRNVPTDPDCARVRYEAAPPDYLNVLTDLQGSTNEDALALITRRADQAMLAEGGVLPRCTEFIVEWSFGEASGLLGNGPTDLLWYGVTTETDFRFTQYTTANGNGHSPFAGRRNAIVQNVAGYQTPPALIYGSVIPPRTQTQTAHFGYFDPFYSPLSGANPDPNKPLVAPWAWPKLVRITVSMVDERDPLKEERFQWVFELPGTPDPQ